MDYKGTLSAPRSVPRSFRVSFPNAVWECTGEGTSVPQAGVSGGGIPLQPADTHLHAKQSFADKRIPKQ